MSGALDLLLVFTDLCNVAGDRVDSCVSAGGLHRHDATGLRQVHVDRAQPEDNRGGFLPPSPGKSENATGRGVGVGWHVGCYVNNVVDLSKQRSSHHVGVAQLTVVSECFWEECAPAGFLESAGRNTRRTSTATHRLWRVLSFSRGGPPMGSLPAELSRMPSPATDGSRSQRVKKASFGSSSTV